jgi:hypothetical protein
MRAHGVAGFPDPLRTGGFARGEGPGPSPAARAAVTTCRPLLRATVSGRAPTPGERAELLRYARCMREHGVPGFPDPMTRSQVPPDTNVLAIGALVFPMGPGLDPGSPSFMRAGAACGGDVPGGRPAGQPRGG